MKPKISIVLKLVLGLFLTITASNLKAQMVWDQTAQFAGNTGSYIAVPNSAGVNLTGSFSFEAWVNPTSVSTTDKGIISKGSTLGASLRYGLRIIPGGRVSVYTNGISRVTSASGTPLTVGVWKHICATYNSTTNVFTIYLNGVLSATATVVSAAPATNTDSLYIGVSGTSSSFAGQMDDVRIWNRDLTASEAAQFFRSTIATASGLNYRGIVLSLPFQKNNTGGIKFSTLDWSGNGNHGFNRSVNAVDLTEKNSNTTFPNESVELDGTGDYLSGPSNSLVSPTSAITLETWIFPRTVTTVQDIISKNAATSYNLSINATGKIVFNPKGGGTVIQSKQSLRAQKWTHIAATYNGTTTSIYINGVLDTAATAITGAIGTNSDSLFIGSGLVAGVPGNSFNGFIDEVRISNYMKTQDQINKFLFKSIDSLNQPVPASNNVCYNFDGYTVDNGDGGPRMYFQGSSRFSHPATIDNQPVSPLNRLDSRNFVDGWVMRQVDKRLPASTGIGTVDDSIIVPFNVSIYDINIFVAINHKNEADLDLFLIGPNGESIDFSTDNTMIGLNDNVVTVFDDQAENLVTSVQYVSFTPVIRPEKNFSTIFTGDNSQGLWRLRITDDAGSADTGRLYGWGIQFNNSTTTSNLTNLNLTCSIEGMWNGATHVQDTIRTFIRNTVSPYAIVDSARIFLDPSGNGVASFLNVGNATKYISIKHRNAVETWSSTGVVFKIDSTTTYNFTTAASKAFGNNMRLKAGRFCFYSGDVNQDGLIEAADLSAVDNAAANFVIGYVRTDLTGDNFVDGTDYGIADNNAFNFISSITPP